MATTARALGAVGCVCDAGLRDAAEVRALGFHYFCAGFVVSHGNAVIVDVRRTGQDLRHAGRAPRRCSTATSTAC